MKFEVGKLPYIVIAINREDILSSLDDDFKPYFDEIDDEELWYIISNLEDNKFDTIRGDLYMDICYEVAQDVEGVIENKHYQLNRKPIPIKEKK